jgi:hypothetical protein
LSCLDLIAASSRSTSLAILKSQCPSTHSLCKVTFMNTFENVRARKRREFDRSIQAHEAGASSWQESLPWSRAPALYCGGHRLMLVFRRPGANSQNSAPYYIY